MIATWFQPRRLRFSLRALLLGISLIGGCLAVYRWPWEEWDPPGVLNFNAASGYYGRTVTFRRDWRGNAVKHGPERWLGANGRVVYEALYADDNRVNFQEFDKDGKVTKVVTGQPPRPEDVLPGGTVVERRVLAPDRFLIEWKSPTGERLQSEELQVDQGLLRLLRWNGRPPEEEARQLIAQLSDPGERLGWQSPASPSSSATPPQPLSGKDVRSIVKQQSIEWLGAGIFRRNLAAQRGELVLQVRYSPLISCLSANEPIGFLDLCDSDDSIDENLQFLLVVQRRLLQKNYTLQPRFGILAAVRITPANLQPGDPTGVLAVRFQVGSPAERAWLETVPQQLRQSRTLREQLEQLFAGTGLTVDTSGVISPFGDFLVSDSDLSVTQSSTAPPLMRTRRDILGSVLWHHNLRVEQQGETLAILLPKSPKP